VTVSNSNMSSNTAAYRGGGMIIAVDTVSSIAVTLSQLYVHDNTAGPAELVAVEQRLSALWHTAGNPIFFTDADVSQVVEWER
jgi:hypothetical protein